MVARVVNRDENRKTTLHGVRLNGEDRAIIEAAAKATGQTLVSYMRAAALEKADPSVATPPPPPHDPGEGITPQRRSRVGEIVKRTAMAYGGVTDDGTPRPLERVQVEPRPKGGR